MSVTDAFDRVRVLCLGDLMVDRFVGGAVHRISPESPIPVFSIVGEDVFPGGAANVARNVVALGAACTLIGVVGDDKAARELAGALDHIPAIRSHFVATPDRPTTEKIRFVAQGQHMLRADREDARPISAEIEDEVLAGLEALVGDHDVLVLSDYAKGVLTDRVIRRALDVARRAGVPSIVDPKSADLSRYAGATVMTPNAREAQLATGIDCREEDAAVLAGQRILDLASVDAVLITRAERGITLVPRAGEPVHLPASAREVFDVVGAGDTVVATLALAMGARITAAEAAMLANAAAGLVVGKRGTATISRTELIDELHRISRTGMVSSSVKTLTLNEAQEQVAAWRRDGFRIGFTNGCFDILHVGHIATFEFAKGHCDRLIVGLNSDASVTRLKGPKRPINDEGDRAAMLGALSVVDCVVIFAEDTPEALIRQLQPDVLVKGSDYGIDEIAGADIVLGRGGDVLTCELVPGRSTTKTLELLAS